MARSFPAMLGTPANRARAVRAQATATMAAAIVFSGPFVCPAERRSIKVLVFVDGFVPRTVFRHSIFLNRRAASWLAEKGQSFQHGRLEGARGVISGDETGPPFPRDGLYRVQQAACRRHSGNRPIAHGDH